MYKGGSIRSVRVATRIVKCPKCDEKVNLADAIESRGGFVCPKCLCPLNALENIKVE